MRHYAASVATVTDRVVQASLLDPIRRRISSRAVPT